MAQRNRVTIVIDCNWYISASINRKSRRTVYKLISDPSLTVVYSDELLKEYRSVIKRDRFKKIIKLSQANRFIEFLKTKIVKFNVKQVKTVSRDQNDDYLLGLARISAAEYLITGDKDLLVLKSYYNTKILTMNQFIEIAKYDNSHGI
jgi:putative PIN family toxin of toxin-antitoxin system